ncbi:hypothetical protein AB0P21_27880 [Kribbella sp. NPDC056861]|uniref:effector-associated constant component EACC1 n=1 Tax=Kribbella sp. NPDC056861 TaxID=3154857 RepID=UPI003421D5BE
MGWTESDVRWFEIVVLADDELDAERVDRLARQLRRELAEREFDTRAVTGEAPGTSKGDAAAVGAIAVALVGAGGMIPTLIAVLRDWLGRRSGPERISLKFGEDSIELDRPSFDEREQLLRAFLAKHTDE